MNKSKMKEIRRQVRSADLDNASQMNKTEERIYERNPDTDQIKSRKKGDYGNEVVEECSSDCACHDGEDMQVEAYNESFMDTHNVRREVLNELWTSNKILKDGYWYVKLTDVIKIIADYNELYENESK